MQCQQDIFCKFPGETIFRFKAKVHLIGGIKKFTKEFPELLAFLTKLFVHFVVFKKTGNLSFSL